jgi:hypothetical protein
MRLINSYLKLQFLFLLCSLLSLVICIIYMCPQRINIIIVPLNIVIFRVILFLLITRIDFSVNDMIIISTILLSLVLLSYIACSIPLQAVYMYLHIAEHTVAII